MEKLKSWTRLAAKPAVTVFILVLFYGVIVGLVIKILVEAFK